MRERTFGRAKEKIEKRLEILEDGRSWGAEKILIDIRIIYRSLWHRAKKTEYKDRVMAYGTQVAKRTAEIREDLYEGRVAA